MKKLLLLIAVAMLTSIATMAQPRSEQQAIQIAQDFFAKSTKKKAPKLSVVSQQKVTQQIRKKVAAAKKAPAQHSSCYIINDEANNRFVIVSADERMYEILGYSDNGCFEAENAPEGLLFMLGEYDGQFEEIQGEFIATANEVSEVSTTPIEPLIKSTWGQGEPYNMYCPENKKYATQQKSASGCVATAMAQVMNFHKYPQKGQGGTYSYITNSQATRLTVNFDDLHFNWNYIKDHYNESSTAAEREEVAKLMYACGVSVSMDYGNDNYDQSGASPYNIAYALIHHFGYSPNAIFCDRNYYADSTWNKVIMHELALGRPILYGGRGFFGGHRFILDGCNKEGLYHFNFGWDGDNDGFFHIDAITPGLLYDFSSNQSMVCGISPSEIGQSEDVFYSDNFKFSSLTFNIGSSSRVSFSPVCYSSSTTIADEHNGYFQGYLGIGIFNEEWEYISNLYETITDKLTFGQGYNISKSITFPSSMFKEGTSFYIAPYARANTSQVPTKIRTLKGLNDWYYASVKDGKIMLVLNGGPKHKVLPIETGDYKASANSEEYVWDINVWKDNDDASKYWFSDLDPVVGEKGFTYASGWNKVYGLANEEHTQILIPTNQDIGPNIRLGSISGGSNIIVTLKENNKKMYISGIDGIWGSSLTSDNGENASVTEVSRFQYTTIKKTEPEIKVGTPQIDVTADGTLTIRCSTEKADIYYTIDGSIPNTNSTKFVSPVLLDGNFVIKAIAESENKMSDIAEYKVNIFNVKTPTLHQEGNDISLSCATENATIYYSLDGSMPSTKYVSQITLSQSCIIKFIAKRDYYNDSKQVEMSVIYLPQPTPSDDEILIADNIAGQLSSRISEEEKASVLRLTITGEINGTDVVFIREMTQENSLTDLDLSAATIVEGGEEYDSIIHAVTKKRIVGKYMFEHCSKLLSIALPNNTIKIENNAFSGCKSLKELNVPEACTEIEGSVFSQCTNLEVINIPKSVYKIHDLAIYNCPNLQCINVSSENSWFTSVDGILFSLDKTSLLRYPEGKAETKYSIPEGVTSIHSEAFDHALFEEVEIPQTVTSIGSSAFENCKNLQSVAMPESVRTLGANAFSGCTGLNDIFLSSELTGIESFTFSRCVNLKEILIGKKINSISPLAFYLCSSLQKFYVEEENVSFTSIEGVLFSKDMTALVKCPMALYKEDYYVPYGVKTINDEAFASCKNISRFFFPSSLTSIGASAFENCSMSTIALPQSVVTIGDKAFSGCSLLETFAIPENVSEVGSFMLNRCKNLSYIYIPENVKAINVWAFANNESLSMINSQIKDIENVSVTDDAFEKIPNDCTWRVPAGGPADYDKYARMYKERPWWVSTWNIIIDKGTGIDDMKNTIINDGSWFTLQGTRLIHKPTQRGIYLHGGKKVMVK